MNKFFNQKPNSRLKKGDTLVEIMFAVAVFGLVAVGTIGIMNRGVYDAQRALEVSMARNEIDAQAESLRFIQSAAVSEKKTASKIYTPVWNSLVSNVYKPSNLPSGFFSGYYNTTCDSIYANNEVFTSKSFIVNIRRLDPATIKAWSASMLNIVGDAPLIQNLVGATHSQIILDQTPTYPRLLYTPQRVNNSLEDTSYSLSDNDVNTTSTYYDILTKAQGIWVTGVAADDSAKPEYYDFYIRTCWFSPGSDDPVTVSTVVRLFNINL